MGLGLGDLAAALAFATVFGFATLVAGLATALALATVLALAVVFADGVVRRRGARARVGAGVAPGRDYGHRAGEQSRHGGGHQQSSTSSCHHIDSLLLLQFLEEQDSAISFGLPNLRSCGRLPGGKLIFGPKNASFIIAAREALLWKGVLMRFAAGQ
jgi:hypothetical protein